ncbi:MAG: endonuclease/exonuclease/phosphatase family protein, partial [Syntrophaceae bacterium]
MKRLRIGKKSIHQTLKPRAWFRSLDQFRRKRKTEDDPLNTPVPNTGVNLNVMSFNIRHGEAQDGRNQWIFRRSLVQEVFHHYRPDVLGVQEALNFQVSEINSMLHGYMHVGIGNLGGSQGLHNSIFYNAERFVLSDESTFWFSDTPHIPGSKGWGNIIPRSCTWARLIEKNTRYAFYFFNIHLDHLSQRSRKKGVVFLTRFVHSRPYPEPFVLAGDFNAREKSTPIQFLQGKIPLKIRTEGNVTNPEPVIDTFRVRYPNQRNVATFHGFRKYFFRFKIDYIFVSPPVRVLDA